MCSGMTRRGCGGWMEDHVRRAEAPRPGTRAVARPQAAAAAAEREAWLRGKNKRSGSRIRFPFLVSELWNGCLDVSIGRCESA